MNRRSSRILLAYCCWSVLSALFANTREEIEQQSFCSIPLIFPAKSLKEMRGGRGGVELFVSRFLVNPKDLLES